MKITTSEGLVKEVGNNFLSQHYQSVKSYHNSQNRSRPYKLGAFKGVGLGLEIEMGNDHLDDILNRLECEYEDYDCEEELVDDYTNQSTYALNKVVGGLVNYENDCSVRYGCELITRTMTKEFFDKDFPWEKFEPVVNEWYDEGQNTCGLHLHISANLLGDVGSQKRRRALQKLIVFTNYFSRRLTNISGREDLDQLDEYASFYYYGFDYIDTSNVNELKSWSYEALINSGDRYKALNLCNVKRYVDSGCIDTIEYRFFASTFKAKRIRAIVDLLWTITKNAKTVSWNNVTNLNCWLKGIKQETRDTLGI